MFNILIWVAATVAIFASDNVLVPSLVAVGLALVIATVRNRARKNELERLVSLYVTVYGSPPPGFTGGFAGTGWAAGAMGGNALVGGLIGAAVDIARTAVAERDMSDEQKTLQRRIAGLQAWTPFHGVFLLGMWLALSGGLLWGWDVVRSP